jgi:hypothetical protein
MFCRGKCPGAARRDAGARSPRFGHARASDQSLCTDNTASHAHLSSQSACRELCASASRDSMCEAKPGSRITTMPRPVRSDPRIDLHLDRFATQFIREANCDLRGAAQAHASRTDLLRRMSPTTFSLAYAARCREVTELWLRSAPEELAVHVCAAVGARAHARTGDLMRAPLTLARDAQLRRKGLPDWL